MLNGDKHMGTLARPVNSFDGSCFNFDVVLECEDDKDEGGT